MKNIIVFFMLLSEVLFVSCGDEKDLRMSTLLPLEFMIEVVDENGNNLMNPEYDGNILGEEIVVEYADSLFRPILNTESYQPQKDGFFEFEPYLYGLQIYKQVVPGSISRWLLSFGDFPASYMNAEYDCILRINDLEYQLKGVVRYNEDSKPREWKEFYIDGKSIGETYVYKIILDSSQFATK